MGKPDEKRRSPRFSVEVPVTVRVQNGGVHEQSSKTRDISERGIFLYSDSELVPGAEMELVVMLPPELTNGSSAWVCCQARVVRVEDPGADGMFGVAAVMERYAVLPEV
ncbi:MAG TPA: PilZ domain-containing protein [Terriglobales bacterium]|nr:PilZ domain-containing protein [Terriglobales bacterium]